jgi:hypothetical protein
MCGARAAFFRQGTQNHLTKWLHCKFQKLG